MEYANQLSDHHSLSTLALHADSAFEDVQDAAPPLHVATTFKYTQDPDLLVPVPHRDTESSVQHDYYYSRISAPTTERFEALLTSLLGADAVAYPSGLCAFQAALILLNPRRVAFRHDLYFGCQGVIDIVAKLSGLQKLSLECDAEQLQTGDLIVLETPLSPSGYALNIAKYAEKAHRHGAWLLVSNTLAPPGLQDPFAHGADLVMHAGSKYIGGHADMLCGVLATNNKDWSAQLRKERSLMGAVVGNFESWLGIRSLRTLQVRIERQTQSAQKLVTWLVNSLSGHGEDSLILKSVIAEVGHTSLQKEDFDWLLTQMPRGFGPLFSITMKTENMARQLPSKLRLFSHQTSFGGVESSIEWRKMSDVQTDSRLLRVSIGLEDWEDLRRDIVSGIMRME
ncbi:cystathionine beta-lyase [Exophiala viscosa]|uniref:cystathionine beta-lyase n=1 Tax=Exophiala viscosa TaxID=2486360 RepID=UPI00219B1382|nr:cystathionine beta-lyase [Exophiala viscosa]